MVYGWTTKGKARGRELSLSPESYESLSNSSPTDSSCRLKLVENLKPPPENASKHSNSNVPAVLYERRDGHTLFTRSGSVQSEKWKHRHIFNTSQSFWRFVTCCSSRSHKALMNSFGGSKKFMVLHKNQPKRSLTRVVRSRSDDSRRCR